MNKDIKCAKCNADVHWMDVFPNDLCLPCYSVSADGRRMVTAEELTAMWGG